ncbi:MAG: magnesium transporter CorA family protein [Anaerolineae bacterium]|nr:magnesium transporter CorA family protein [Anaerolineae bacterium]
MLHIRQFNAQGLHTLPEDSLGTLPPDHIVWVDIHRPSPEVMKRLQEQFHFHPLAIEDTLNQQQRPKVEEYDDHLFIITNHMSLVNGAVQFLEMDIFLGRHYIVTVHDDCSPVIEEAVRRLGRSSHFRHISSEYLLYIVMDAVVDAYFPVVAAIDSEIEQAGETVLRRPVPALLERLLQLRRILGEMWHVIEQQHGMFSVLTRREEDLLIHRDVLQYYLRDVDDHLQRNLNNVSILRENLTSIVEIYLSAASYQLNRVVNRLTVITITIGIFTVFGGIYGMNFERTFPPFEAEWGAPFAVSLMAGVSLVALLFFRRMKWF